MKGIILLTLATALLVAAGLVGREASLVQGHLADAQQHVATLQYADAQSSLDAAEGAIGYAKWLPRFGAAAERDIRTRKAALLYWTRKYDVLVPEGADPVSAIEEGSADLQLVVANAAHRQGMATATDRAALLQALEESASSYLTVLKNSEFSEDAAFNYEYIIRLKEELARNRKTPPPSEEKQDGDMGQSGSPSEATSQQGFEIYIPLESTERPAGGDAGKAPTKDRKG